MPPSSKTTPWRKIEYDNNTSQMAEALVNRSGAALMATVANCGTKQTGRENQNKEPLAASSDVQPEPVDPSLVERIRRERWTGDLSGMVERRYIRALVTYNRTYYFYYGAEARGIAYEALKEFEKLLNEKLQTGRQRVHVIFI